MAGLSEVGICNLGLGWVGGNLITSLDDEVDESKLCKANYALLRDALLESADWSFATIRATGGSPLVAPPAWGFSKQFQITPGILRIIYVGQSARIEEDDPVIAWVREGDKILCDATQIYIRGIQRVEDTNLFSILFGHALAARIAMDLAIPIAHSRSLQADMSKLYSLKMSEAVAQDAKQGRSRVIRARGMQQARRAGAIGVVGPTV